MELFIQIADGQAVEHPIHGANLREAYPSIDVNNLPSNLARFERVEAPELGPYETNQRVQYELGADGVCRDVWYCDQMSDAEILVKQNSVKAAWASGLNYSSWVFNESSCEYEPPIPMPDDGGFYTWDEDSVSWAEVEEGLS